MAKPIILCVDDEKVVLTSLMQELQHGLGDRYNFEIAESGEEGLEVIDEFLRMGMQIPVVISDQLMPGMKGDEFLTEVNKMQGDIRKILLTGQASADAVGNAVNQANLYRYIAKPWEEDDLRLTVEEAAKSFLTSQKLSEKLKTLEDLNKYGNLLSRDVQPETMMQTLLKHTLEDTNAARGAVMMFQDEENGWLVQGALNNGEAITQLDEGLIIPESFPKEIIQYVRQQKESVLLPNAFRKGDFINDPYIFQNKTRSVLCTPITVENRLIGLLYLEQGKEIRFFDGDKTDFLNLLLAQVSTAFDNSLLYHNLERKIEDRTKTIQEINQELLNSITYASRIQEAISPDLEKFQDRLPESFVLYQPKDIVSGDFYWMNHIDGKTIIAAVDCTGHGVPGAIMTVIGNTQIQHIITDTGELDPGTILSKLDLRVREALKQDDAATDSQDGMDLALCIFDEEAGQLSYGGAMNPLFLIREGELTEYKANKFPIGGSQYDEKLFTTVVVEVQAGDRFYIFSDGYIDQFGGQGSRPKRFGSKRFKAMLLEIQELPMAEQQAHLQQVFDTYKGEDDQLDDVLVVGVEIPGK